MRAQNCHLVDQAVGEIAARFVDIGTVGRWHDTVRRSRSLRNDTGSRRGRAWPRRRERRDLSLARLAAQLDGLNEQVAALVAQRRRIASERDQLAREPP